MQKRGQWGERLKGISEQRKQGQSEAWESKWGGEGMRSEERERDEGKPRGRARERESREGSTH